MKRKVGDSVQWQTKEGEYIKGKILKIYETTFGSTVKDTAFQIQLEKPRKGRSVTTVRAKNCIDDTRGDQMEETIKVNAEIVPKDEIIKADENDVANIDPIVEKIVAKWNTMVANFENTTIKLCLMIDASLKDYPHKTAKDILTKVKNHPDIKRFVSIDRIWQGRRLMKDWPHLIEYHQKTPEQKARVKVDDRPYLKKDGEIFWEFYFEIAKQPFDMGMMVHLEQEGIKNKWSFRQLRENVAKIKENLAFPNAMENQEKREVIAKVVAILRTMPLTDVRAMLKGIEIYVADKKKKGENAV